MYPSGMFGVTTTIKGFSGGDVTPIKDAIASVFRNADRSWRVALIAGQDGSWNLFGRPEESQGFQARLGKDRQNPEAVREIVSDWYLRSTRARVQ